MRCEGAVKPEKREEVGRLLARVGAGRARLMAHERLRKPSRSCGSKLFHFYAAGPLDDCGPAANEITWQRIKVQENLYTCDFWQIFICVFLEVSSGHRLRDSLDESVNTVLSWTRSPSPNCYYMFSVLAPGGHTNRSWTSAQNSRDHNECLGDQGRNWWSDLSPLSDSAAMKSEHWSETWSGHRVRKPQNSNLDLHCLYPTMKTFSNPIKLNFIPKSCQRSDQKPEVECFSDVNLGV